MQVPVCNRLLLAPCCCRKDKERGKRESGGPSESRDQGATNGRHKERGPRGRGRQEDAAALAAAAASLNTFKGDGSFMESFQQRAGKPSSLCIGLAWLLDASICNFKPEKACQLLVSSSDLACVLINRETIATLP